MVAIIQIMMLFHLHVHFVIGGRGVEKGQPEITFSHEHWSLSLDEESRGLDVKKKTNTSLELQPKLKEMFDIFGNAPIICLLQNRPTSTATAR